MNTIQVFRTDVSDLDVAVNIVLLLEGCYAHCRVNFDLEDCDRILRIESAEYSIEETAVQWLVAGYGYHCEPLPE